MFTNLTFIFIVIFKSLVKKIIWHIAFEHVWKILYNNNTFNLFKIFHIIKSWYYTYTYLMHMYFFILNTYEENV